jgi:hypothetical protein
MNFKLPFGDISVNEMAGKIFALADNKRNEPWFRTFWDNQVKVGGEFGRGYFEVVDGVLRLNDKQGLYAEFLGLESRNGVVFATGTIVQDIPKEGWDRVVLYERQFLDSNDIGICITSHVNYEKTTLPVILDSINKSKFDMSKVVAVVGGYKGAKTEVIEGAEVQYRADNVNGLGGLLGVTDKAKYWLLIHDTSEIERSFLEGCKTVDVGLNPDVVKLREDGNDWTGFYSQSFVNKTLDELIRTPQNPNVVIGQYAKVVTNLHGKIQELGTRDVYGTGRKRVIERFPVGIRKYKKVGDRRTGP